MATVIVPHISLEDQIIENVKETPESLRPVDLLQKIPQHSYSEIQHSLIQLLVENRLTLDSDRSLKLGTR